MTETVLYSIKSINYQSANYNETKYNSLTPWKKADIDTKLIINDIECPPMYYNSHNNKCIAVGWFGIVGNGALNQYKMKIIDIMTSVQFTNQFTENMNNKIDNNIYSESKSVITMIVLKLLILILSILLNYTLTEKHMELRNKVCESESVHSESTPIFDLFLQKY
eukprot:220464_1